MSDTLFGTLLGEKDARKEMLEWIEWLSIEGYHDMANALEKAISTA